MNTKVAVGALALLIVVGVGIGFHNYYKKETTPPVTTKKELVTEKPVQVPEFKPYELNKVTSSAINVKDGKVVVSHQVVALGNNNHEYRYTVKNNSKRWILAHWAIVPAIRKDCDFLFDLPPRQEVSVVFNMPDSPVLSKDEYVVDLWDREGLLEANKILKSMTNTKINSNIFWTHVTAKLAGPIPVKK